MTTKFLPGRIACLWLCFGLAVPAAAATNRIERFQVADRGAGTRLVLEFASEPKYRVLLWREPKRLLVDVENAAVGISIRSPPRHPLLGTIEAKPAGPSGKIRLVVDLKREVRYLAELSQAGRRFRLTLDLIGVAPARPAGSSNTRNSARPVQSAPAVPPAGKPRIAGAHPAPESRRRDPVPIKPSRHRVVAIDAGHGGKDTGAVGPAGTREKDVVLLLARKLNGMIRAEPDLRAVMVRKDDRFVPLLERLAIARRARADLLVSLHADASENGPAQGASVFTLSPQAAAREAERWLARRETAAPLLSGLTLRGRPPQQARLLLERFQQATLRAGERAAAGILRQLERRAAVHRQAPQKAGFIVLKSPDIPSVLVEVGFITHPKGERRLADPAEQNRIARAIFYGIRGFFSGRPRAPAAVRHMADSGAASGATARD